MKYLESDQIIEHKTTEPPRFYSASGYGRKIPTQHMVKLADKRWRRVYVCQFSNAGTAYIQTKDEPFLVVRDTEFNR